MRGLLALCGTLLFVLLSVASAGAASAAQKSYEGHTVHVIFSNHLDVGFSSPAGGLDSQVIDLYFHTHLPHAVQLAKDVAASPNNTHGDAFRYMSHSWLLSLFLDCPEGMGWTCPNATEVEAVVGAIESGVITWHAMPFNPQYEVFDSSLLRFAVDLTHALDDRFGQPHKRMASLRDVPGMTRAAIPILASQGVRALSSGVNGFSAPPGVPKTTPFIWLDEQTGSQLIYMAHPGGYAGVRPDGLHIDSHRDCIHAPGLKHVMCASWGDDNLGPPADAATVLAMFDHVRSQWPGADVAASTMEAYLQGLTEALEQGGLTLPVVTGEVGDTWIHGIASDPARMADYRAVLRARREHCEAAAPTTTPSHCDTQSPAYFNFSRLLLKVPEHTWGVSFNQYFGDFTNYTNAWLHQHLTEGEGVHAGLALSVESWRRQRHYIEWALEALPPGHPIVSAVAADRSARQALSSVSAQQLLEAGAQQRLSELHTTTQVSSPQQPPPSAAAATLPASKPLVVRGGAASIVGGGVVGGRCAALVAAAAAGSGGGDGDNGLLFCSRNWLVQVDKHTGGLTRVQRVYGEGDDAQLGNDWAGGSSKHCTCQHSNKQQQEQEEAAAAASPAVVGSPAIAVTQDGGASWRERLAVWWRSSYSKGLLTALLLPSPETAASLAEFAVGDEASAAQRHHASSTPLNTAATAAHDAPTAAPAAATHAAAQLASTPTAVYRRLLSLNRLWRSGAAVEPTSTSTSTNSAHQQQQPSEDAPLVGCQCRSSSSPAFAELQYNVYSLQDYDPVWEHYAYIHPVWVGDFGKFNLSASINMSEVAKPKLVQVFDQSTEDSLHLSLELHFPKKLVKHAGAPATAWLLLQSDAAAAGDSPQLHLTLVWQNKTATRLPEALWLRFKPGRRAVNHHSWLMHKLDGAISPSELVLNGSHSLHAVTRGVSVSSRDGAEQLHISSMDVPLLNLGAPNPLPNPCDGPDMKEGVSFNPVNNIWGTNYAMWVPFVAADANMAFRFTLDVQHASSADSSSLRQVVV